MLFLVLNSAIRNPHSAIGTANFFMDDTACSVSRKGIDVISGILHDDVALA